NHIETASLFAFFEANGQILRQGRSVRGYRICPAAPKAVARDPNEIRPMTPKKGNVGLGTVLDFARLDRRVTIDDIISGPGKLATGSLKIVLAGKTYPLPLTWPHRGMPLNVCNPT